jgi:hypothetical protein
MQLANWTDKDEMYINVNYSNLTNWQKYPDRETSILYDQFISGTWNVNHTFGTLFNKTISRTKLNFFNYKLPEPFRLYSPKWLLFNGSETDQTIYSNYTYKLFDNDSIWYATIPVTVDTASAINITVNQYNSTIINITAVNTTTDQTMDITVENSTFNITNGEWYRITKDGTQAATAQANSNNNITFTDIAVGSEYIIEITTASITTAASEGGGGSSQTTTCSIGTIQCINSLHYKECLEYGTTNKWSETLDLPKGSQCRFGKIVELKKEEIKEDIKEEPEEEKQEIKEEEETTPESKTTLSWLWVTIAVITILLIVYSFLRKKK